MLTFLHDCGEKRISIGISSSLPAIMQNDKTNLLKPEKSEKFPMGPTASKPGPIFEIAAMTEVTVVAKSLPSNEINRIDTVKIRK